MSRARWLMGAAVLATAATVGAVQLRSQPRPQATPTVSPSPSASETAQPGASPEPEPPHPVSLQALMQQDYHGRSLRVGRVLSRQADYVRHAATYRSGDLRISGIINIPRGDGPFPALVLNHGYIDPDIYVTGQGLRREQDYLARNGYVVLHIDYRNHASSDEDPENAERLRLGYIEDAINAVLALRASDHPSIDGERVGMLGRSMGGGVTLGAIVVRPDIVDAAVIYSSVSSDVVDNFNKWTRGGDGGRRALARRIERAYGSPEDEPAFWRNVSPRTFFDRVAAPVLVHHGTADDTTPIVWSEQTVDALEAAGKSVRYYRYDGENHAFGPQWTRSMRRTVSFLDRYLDG